MREFEFKFDLRRLLFHDGKLYRGIRDDRGAIGDNNQDATIDGAIGDNWRHDSRHRLGIAQT